MFSILKKRTISIEKAETTQKIICFDRHYNRKHMSLKEIKKLSDCLSTWTRHYIMKSGIFR